MSPLPARQRRILDFDLETVAAGFADPDWVPQTITAWAYAWVNPGKPEKVGGSVTHPSVEVAVLPVAAREDYQARRRFLEPLVDAILSAHIVTGHNILRFDLPVLNADLLRVGLPPLPPILAQDTIRLPKSKGFKKGQDVLAGLLGVQAEKLPLNWLEWQKAYAEPDQSLIKERVAGDVVQHVQLREAMRERGWLTAPRMWRP